MPKLHRFGFLVAFALLISVGCSTSSSINPRDTELVVFAASSLTEAFQEVSAAFETQNPEVKIILNLAGSQRLSTQLVHGARADLFASADWRQMDSVTEADLVQGQPVNFASNRLVMIASTFIQQPPTLQYLAQPGTKVVLAQPNVPAGSYTRDLLKNLQADKRFGPGYSSKVLANVVSEESNVRNVAQKVALGEADAGIVYQTDVISGDIAGRVQVVAIPEPLNITASYPIAIMKNSSEQAWAQRYMDFLLSESGQSVLRQHGFGSVHQVDSIRDTAPTPSGSNR